MDKGRLKITAPTVQPESLCLRSPSVYVPDGWSCEFKIWLVVELAQVIIGGQQIGAVNSVF